MIWAPERSEVCLVSVPSPSDIGTELSENRTALTG